MPEINSAHSPNHRPGKNWRWLLPKGAGSVVSATGAVDSRTVSVAEAVVPGVRCQGAVSVLNKSRICHWVGGPFWPRAVVAATFIKIGARCSVLPSRATAWVSHKGGCIHPGVWHRRGASPLSHLDISKEKIKSFQKFGNFEFGSMAVVGSGRRLARLERSSLGSLCRCTLLSIRSWVGCSRTASSPSGKLAPWTGAVPGSPGLSQQARTTGGATAGDARLYRARWQGGKGSKHFVCLCFRR